MNLSLAQEDKVRRRLATYTIALPLILKALPQHDAAPLGAADITEAVGFYGKPTIRFILSMLTQIDMAVATEVPCKRGGSKKIYRHAAPAPDDFESASLVYAVDDEEKEEV